MKSIGTTIRWFRERVSWTQCKLADRLGYSRRSISRIEGGGGWSPVLIEQWQESFEIDLYVLHWCRTGELDKLPKPMRDAACALACVWDQKIEYIITRLRKEDAA